MEFHFAKRMGLFQEVSFSQLDARRRELEQRGRKVYNLSVGTPDFPPAPHVMQALTEAASKPENWKYALSDRSELIQAVQNWYKRRYQVELEPAEIMSLYGSQEGLTHIGLAVCDPGDVVLAPNPGYPIFEMGPFLCGAKIVHYDLLEEKGYLPDLSSIPEETARAAKMMVVSYPANPICRTAPASFY